MESLKEAILSGRYEEARPLCWQALALQPDNPALLYYVGALEVQAGNHQEAKKHLVHLLEIQPDHVEGRFQLGLACFKSGNDQGAVAIFHLLPGHRLAQGYLGQLYAQGGAHAAAVLAFEKAVALGGEEWLADLANACLEAGLTFRAEAIMRELLQNPQARCDARWVAKALGRHLIRQKRWEELFSLFVPLTHRAELLIAARTVMAAAYLEQGNVPAAIDMFPPNVIATNWSHTFVVTSISQFRQALLQIGQPLPTRRPHPYPESDIGVTASSLGYYGRFTHQCYEYLFLRWHADRTGVPMETPDWVGRYVFDLDDPEPSGKRVFLRRPSAWIEDQIAAKGAQALAGFDFFSPTGFLSWKAQYSVKARELFRIRPVWLPRLEPVLSSLKARGDTIVSIHFRLTDYLQVASSPPTQWYLEWLRGIWPTLKNPVLYLASDDLDAVIEDFAEFNPCSLKDVAPSWPGLEWLQDFFVLMNSDALATSIGGFGLFAGMLNSRGKIFARPNSDKECLIPYLPLEYGITGP